MIIGNLGDIVLIATHVDKTRAGKGQHGEWISPDAQKTLQTVKKTMSYIPNLKSNVIVLDSNVPASYGFKQLKCMLSSIKQDNELKQYEQFPVLSRSTFSEILRNQVNLLASDEHIDELLQQLSYMGEVFCIYDHIVISISWLGTELLGELLSANFLQHARVTGVYTAEDFQACFNQCDALGALSLLEDLSLCIRCDLEEEVEYEFPIYNRIETLEGLWDSDDPRYTGKSSHYGGVRLCTPPNTCHLLQSVFVFIQIDLRRATLANFTNNDSDMDLYQWYMGSKLCNVDLESLITLEEGNYAQYIEIKVRGPNNSSQCCFYFLEQILHTIFTSISRVCPGLLLERHILSPEDLRMHSKDPFLYNPHIINSAMLEAESTSDVIFYNSNIGQYESVVQLVMFGDPELANGILWGCGLKVQDLPSAAKLKLCGLLDPPEPHGRDWCLLALRLGLNQEKIAALDSQYSSHTMRLLTVTECSIGALITSLHDLDRLDAVEVVLRSAPLFKLRNDLD
ncbi:hypothetical protein WA026_000568 [Henosepilachna vigintioctopunctata]|uniref:Death domain-containing protein n=1 Tax=Henosepilachna vigintioctopunctata TaxID=420089 RepID=A0AAW1V6E5_9CUCU